MAMLARVLSRSSRSAIAAERPRRLALIPFSFNCLYRLLALSSALAVKYIFRCRFWENHRAHIAAIGNQARRLDEMPVAWPYIRPYGPLLSALSQKRHCRRFLCGYHLSATYAPSSNTLTKEPAPATSNSTFRFSAKFTSFASSSLLI